jgi:hypothetical protein
VEPVWDFGGASTSEASVAVALRRNTELHELWRHVAWISRCSEDDGLLRALDAIGEYSFRAEVFRCFWPN